MNAEQKKRAAVGLSLFAPLAALLVAVASCYPDFQFGASSATSDTASSTASRPGADSATNAQANGSTSGTHGATSGVTSSKAAASTSGGSVFLGAPCDVTPAAHCTGENPCCFNKTAPPPDDYCGACVIGNVELHCTADTDCPSQQCCAMYDSDGLVGTVCRSSCASVPANFTASKHACNPTAVPQVCNCETILDSFYMNGVALPPYDQYGQCH